MPSVVVDDVEGGRIQAEYLHMKGHRHVIYRQSSKPFSSARARVQSFLRVAGELGMKVTMTREQVPYMVGLQPEEIDALKHQSATAFVAWEDIAGFRICEAVEEIGFTVGNQIAVVAFNGFNPILTPKYRLTTVYAPWYQVGLTAVNHISSLIHRHAVPAWTCLPVSLVQGETA
jgi:LacI family transcriptional regulator